MMVGIFNLPTDLDSELIDLNDAKWFDSFLGIVDRYTLFDFDEFNEDGLLSRGKVVSILYQFLKNR